MHQNMHQWFPSSSNSQHISSKSFSLLVPGGGVEPPRPCDRRILSPLRLPVPPSRRISILSALKRAPINCTDDETGESFGTRTLGCQIILAGHNPPALLHLALWPEPAQFVRTRNCVQGCEL